MAFRRFDLCRLDDVSGVSGTGRVAEGVCFSSGKAVISWLSSTPSISIFDSVEELLSVHGHKGKTIVRWLDAVGEAAAPESPEQCPVGGG
jgi:hypothetical protein